MNNAAASYFKEGFGLSTESAAAIASIFGWMNLFARGLGGFASNKFNSWMGMRGRVVLSLPIFFEKNDHNDRKLKHLLPPVKLVPAQRILEAAQ